jgi:hypothetical protein
MLIRFQKSAKRKTTFAINDRVLKKKNFVNQLLRMIVALELSFSFLINIELQRAFFCLNNIVKFSFFFIIKNHLMLRCEEIQNQLLRALFDDETKIFLALNCWSSFNRQDYLTINTYFIDIQWIYHEILLTFEHITSSHIEQKLTKMMQDIIVRHKLKERLNVVINDNVSNNLILHIELIKLLRTNRLFDEMNTNVQDLERMSCFAHVIQLVLQELLDKIRIK